MTKKYESRSDKIERKGERNMRTERDMSLMRGILFSTQAKKCILNLISNTKMCNYYNLICRGDNIMGDLCWYVFCVKISTG